MLEDKNIQKTFQIGGDGEGILYLEFLGIVDTVEDNIRQADLIKNHLIKILQDNPERQFNCLVDLSPIKKTTHFPSPKASDIYAQMVDNKQFKKIAIVVPSSLSRAVINFIFQKVIKKTKAKFFKNRGEAIGWLNK